MARPGLTPDRTVGCAWARADPGRGRSARGAFGRGTAGQGDGRCGGAEAGAGGDRRGAGSDVRRGGHQRTAPSGFRSGRHRRLRGAQRRRPGGGDDGEDAEGEISLPVMGVIEGGARIAEPIAAAPGGLVQTGARCPRWPMRCCRCAGPTAASPGCGAARSAIGRLRPAGRRRRAAGRRRGAGRAIIGAAQVGLLAAVGRERVLVHPRPRLTVMSVGGELVDISRTPGNGQVYDVNSYALAAAVPRRRRRGEPARDRQHRAQGTARGGRGSAESGRGRGDRGCGRRGRRRERALGALKLGEMEVARIAMHPGSVQGGQLGREAFRPSCCPQTRSAPWSSSR